MWTQKISNFLDQVMYLSRPNVPEEYLIDVTNPVIELCSYKPNICTQCTALNCKAILRNVQNENCMALSQQAFDVTITCYRINEPNPRLRMIYSVKVFSLKIWPNIELLLLYFAAANYKGIRRNRRKLLWTSLLSWKWTVSLKVRIRKKHWFYLQQKYIWNSVHLWKILYSSFSQEFHFSTSKVDSFSFPLLSS